MSTTKITGLSCWLLGCCLSLAAQSNYHKRTGGPPAEGQTLAENGRLANFQTAGLPFSIQHFSTDNGLPSNGIKGLQWDEKTGFLWIATEAGVARYNGADFQVFNKASSPEMYSERMLFLLRTRDGRIYTSDETGDLFFVMQNKLQFVGNVKVDTRPSTFKLTGRVASGRLFRQSSQQPPADFGFNWFQEQLVPLDESRLLLTHDDTLYDYRAGQPLPLKIAPLEQHSRIFYLDRNLFVFHPAHGFYRISPDSPKKIPVELEGWEKIKEKPILAWDNGMPAPLLVSGSNVWTLSYNGAKLQSRLICTALPRDALLAFLKYDSASGLLFVGTQSRGILIIRKNEVRSVRKTLPAPEQPTAYYSQLALPGGEFLSGKGDQLGGGPNSPAVLAMPGTFNNFIFTDPDSNCWYSHGDTVYTFSYRTHRSRAFAAGSGSITDGFAWSEGHLYIANAIGVGMLGGEGIDYQYRYPQANINSNVPFAMVEINPGAIAIATCNGLFRYNIAGHRLDTLLRIPGICVRALWKYKGYLLIGTYGRGIWVYRDGAIRPIPPDKKGYLLYAHCFVPDGLGYCWISTNRGLFRARPDDMTEAFDKDLREVYYHYYGREDGMDMTELNGGCTPCALPLNDTILSFPSMDGLVWVNPQGPIPTLPEGSIYIDAFMADSQRVNITSLVKPLLPASTRDLHFQLAFPAWVNKENLNIEYQLEPWSKDWENLDLTHGPELHFSNLPYGEYRLLVRKADGP
ncbi:MAG TPA: triple tyrosine motif-containing protein, partial [Puia sp.]|nr:triple tyrosine motif-containing protein [Puia sp.]